MLSIDGDIITVTQLERDEQGKIISVSKKNKEGNCIYKYIVQKEDGIYGVREVFNTLGVKTNHIVVMENGDITNQHLDKDGNITLVTHFDYADSKLSDLDEQEPYKSLPIDLTRSKKAQ